MQDLSLEALPMTQGSKLHRLLSRLDLPSLTLGTLLCCGLLGLGAILGYSALRHKAFERSVVVEGLSEREYPADIAIWPIEFTGADNDLTTLHATLDARSAVVRDFLLDAGLDTDELSYGAPVVRDSYADPYRSNEQVAFRYTGSRTVTVYTDKVELVRNTQSRLGELGRAGLVLTGDAWRNNTQYLFTALNAVKPSMVEEATRNAREVAEKFADDSQSRLGRIRRASQGQFSISDRDANNPHIKSVRVVSTVEYYLAD